MKKEDIDKMLRLVVNHAVAGYMFQEGEIKDVPGLLRSIADTIEENTKEKITNRL